MWKDSVSLALCNETANIFVPFLPSNQTCLLLSSLPPAPWYVYYFQPASLSFSLFQLFYSHLLIFTSSSLSLSLTTTIRCLPTPSQHISISLFSSITSSAMFSFNHPLKKYIHLRTTGLLLDDILCCYSCYRGQFLCSQGGQGLPCKQPISGNAHTKRSKDAYSRK